LTIAKPMAAQSTTASPATSFVPLPDKDLQGQRIA
jgi:hypothetical protein